jgi:hypothetical protein
MAVHFIPISAGLERQAGKGQNIAHSSPAVFSPFQKHCHELAGLFSCFLTIDQSGVSENSNKVIHSKERELIRTAVECCIEEQHKFFEHCLVILT